MPCPFNHNSISAARAVKAAFDAKRGMLVGTVTKQNADTGQLVTNSDFTMPAVRAAKDAKIDLIKLYDSAREAKNWKKMN